MEGPHGTRRVRDLCAPGRRCDPRYPLEGGLAAGRFQLRLPGPAFHARKDRPLSLGNLTLTAANAWSALRSRNLPEEVLPLPLGDLLADDRALCVRGPEV